MGGEAKVTGVTRMEIGMCRDGDTRNEVYVYENVE